MPPFSLMLRHAQVLRLLYEILLGKLSAFFVSDNSFAYLVIVAPSSRTQILKKTWTRKLRGETVDSRGGHRSTSMERRSRSLLKNRAVLPLHS